VRQGHPSEGAEGQEPDDQSDFCRINPQNSFTFVAKSLHGFIVGPHNFSDVGGIASMQYLAPVVYFEESDGSTKAYRLMVYYGHKTLIALLFEKDF